ncbi:GmrSD restriction endonuclease domain-containing protein [Jatrophihabitans sp. DSM 45814]
MTVLAALPVKGRAPLTGYSREQFGQAWTDNNDVLYGHNGCDTRNDILRRDLLAVTLKAGSNGCAVQSGTLHDPYTAKLIPFSRAAPAAVQIDHVVPLGDAWQTGAQQWSAQKRTDLANDPLNLLAVDGPTNESKGDSDAASWLPPNPTYRCAYVARQVAVKARYALWVTASERAAIARVLATCPTQAAPTETGTPPTTTAPATRSTPPPATTQIRPLVPAPSASSTYYPNCAAVRAAGKAPLLRGQPGYRADLDGDGDGVACE